MCLENLKSLLAISPSTLNVKGPEKGTETGIEPCYARLCHAQLNFSAFLSTAAFNQQSFTWHFSRYHPFLLATWRRRGLGNIVKFLHKKTQRRNTDWIKENTSALKCIFSALRNKERNEHLLLPATSGSNIFPPNELLNWNQNITEDCSRVMFHFPRKYTPL